MKKKILLFLLATAITVAAFSQSGLQKHNPLLDFNLSPLHNEKINPAMNSNINPKFNWNLSPEHNETLNPLKNTSINPATNPNNNPSVCIALNPMYTNSLHPKNPNWTGNFLFDKDDRLIGFITIANQNVMLSFNESGEWTGYFIRSSLGDTFNQFDLKGTWTGKFLCPDSSEGYNLFSNEGEWTGEHIK